MTDPGPSVPRLPLPGPATPGTSLRRHHRRFAGLRAITALMLREMSTTYGRSALGYLWAIAEPVAAIALLSVAFSMFIRNPPLGQNFVLFYATGFISLAAYQAIANNVSQAIRFSRPLLAYPAVTFVDAIVARLLLAVATQGLVFFIVMTTILLVSRDSVNVDVIVVLRAWGMIIAFGLGVGLANCFLMSLFPAWQFVWSILNRPLFLVSGVLYLADQLPEEVRWIVLLLPPSHFIMEMRKGFYDTYDALMVSESYVYGFALITAALGLIFLHRFHRVILSEVG